MLVAINYHYIRPSFDSPFPGISGVTPSQLEMQLKLLGSVGTFVSAEQVRAAVRGSGKLPERSIIVTFDDGLSEQYEHAFPVLCRLGIPGVFFITTSPIANGKVATVHKIHLLRANANDKDFLSMLHHHAQERGMRFELPGQSRVATSHFQYDTPDVACLKYLLNFVLPLSERDRLIEDCFNEIFPGGESEISKTLYMNAGQIEKLGSHHCIGSHSHEHLALGLLSPEMAEEIIRLSLIHLERWTGYRPFAMSYPHGTREMCSPQVAEIAARFGIEFAFTVEQAGNANLDQSLLLARFDTNDLPGGKTANFNLEDLFESIPTSSWYQQPGSLWNKKPALSC